MKVVVTGGAGYVGAHVVRALKLAGHTCRVIDDLSTGLRELVRRNEVDLVEGDVGDAAVLDRALPGADAVVHTAGKALVSESVDDPGPYYRVNVVAGHALLEGMRRHGVGRIVFSSTAAVYGVPDEQPIVERTPPAPVNPYGASKLAFEQMLRAYATAYGLKALALRYFNVAGASSDAELGELRAVETHLVPRLVHAALSGAPFNLYGTSYRTRDGTAERDYIHVEDLARAHVQALERLDLIDADSLGGALNIGTGRGSTVREVLQAVEAETSSRVRVLEVPRRAGDPPALVADPSLAARTIGHFCEHDLAAMVRSTLAFVRAEQARGGGPAWWYESRNGGGGAMRTKGMRFGEVVVAKGYLQPDVVQRALEIQRQRDGEGESHKLLGLILLEMGVIDNEQLIETLRHIGAP